MKKTFLIAAAISFLTLAAGTQAADKDGFRPLFNGKDLSGWKLRTPKGHKSWTVENGVLKNTVNAGERLARIYKIKSQRSRCKGR